jgi:AcrR family transcriptional regulator
VSSEPEIQGAADSVQLQGRLLDAAEQCFAQFGLRKTTMEDVAKAGGVSRATLYRHFRNRDDLLMGVVEREARATAQIIKAHLAGIEHPGEHLVEGFVEALEEIPRHPTLAMIVDPDSVGMTSRLVLNSERLANVALEIMMPVMQPAQESGLLRENVDIAVMIEWIYRLLNSYLTVPSATARNREEMKEQLRTMLLPAILR